MRPSRRDQRRGPVPLDTPREVRRPLLARPEFDPDAFGRASEKFARFMGTGKFLVWMTAFVLAWIGWNVAAPERWRFDPYSFTFLTLVLSLQASYAAPLILLAQNRQDDRDRVLNEQDRSRDERALADTEYLTREVAALRIALREVATRDFVRSELRSVLEELAEEGVTVPASRSRDAKRKSSGKKRKRVDEPGAARPGGADSGPDGDLPTPAG
ncbi:DUF1003 domain-containing protein [Kineococcus aurantiacus]|uniref:DUF1003 domain-containing protein n=1 Tax=Kineococcus aurantiacus TaxID=37633 RepID=UPI0015CB15DA|nr:DUF1003 domain-containing protein [Kineococcus aurantiacus]